KKSPTRLRMSGEALPARMGGRAGCLFAASWVVMSFGLQCRGGTDKIRGHSGGNGTGNGRTENERSRQGHDGRCGRSIPRRTPDNAVAAVSRAKFYAK